MEYTRISWFRIPALVVSVLGLVFLTLGIASSGAGADPGNGKGNPCVTKGNDTESPPEGCDKSRPGGHSQGKVCPENHPKGKRVPAVDKGLSPDRAHGNAHGGTEVVCASTATTVPDTTTTTDGGTTPTTDGGSTPTTAVETEVGGIVVQAPGSAGGPGALAAGETARALPEELAFTGTSTSPGWLFAAGTALMLFGFVLFGLPRTQLVPIRARRS